MRLAGVMTPERDEVCFFDILVTGRRRIGAVRVEVAGDCRGHAHPRVGLDRVGLDHSLHQHILDPLSPTGAVFAKKVRESVRGLHKADAERIVGNYPEVKKAEISMWPPWTRYLPGITSHIVIEPVYE